MLETRERPDAWLCELTMQESATELCARQLAVGAGSSAEASAIASRADRDRRRGLRRRLPGFRRLRVSFRRGGPGRVLRGACVRGHPTPGFLPITIEHYANLLDWTGRELRADKRGAIPDHLAPIMERLGLNAIELGGNRAWLRPNVQAGGGPAELACRCRGTPLASLVPGQGGRSHRI